MHRLFDLPSASRIPLEDPAVYSMLMDPSEDLRQRIATPQIRRTTLGRFVGEEAIQAAEMCGYQMRSNLRESYVLESRVTLAQLLENPSSVLHDPSPSTAASPYRPVDFAFRVSVLVERMHPHAVGLDAGTFDRVSNSDTPRSCSVMRTVLRVADTYELIPVYRSAWQRARSYDRAAIAFHTHVEWLAEQAPDLLAYLWLYDRHASDRADSSYFYLALQVYEETARERREAEAAAAVTAALAEADSAASYQRSVAKLRPFHAAATVQVGAPSAAGTPVTRAKLRGLFRR